MKIEKNFFSAKKIAYLAVLVALVVILQLWGSAIPIGPAGLNLSFVLVPITLGAIMLGPICGMILGFVFGFVVLMTGVTGANFFTAYVFNDSPVFTVLTCILKGVAAGFVGGLLFKVLSKKNKYVAVFVASISVPLVNTGLFILGALCMSGAIKTFANSYMPDVAGKNIVYIIIIGLVTVNFFIELAINLVCAPAIYTVDNVVSKQLKSKSELKSVPCEGQSSENSETRPE